MTAVFLPNYSKGNPYQSNLAAELESLGEPVVMRSPWGPLSILRSVRGHSNRSVLHFHWFEPYLFGNWRVTTLAKTMSTLLQLLLLKLLGKRVVWTCHNVSFHEAKFPRVEYHFKRTFVRFGLCDRIFVHCETVIEDVIETYDLPSECRERMTVVPHGHYIDNYENPSDAERARTDLGLTDAETVFLFFGLIRPYKGVFDLIEAFVSVSSENDRLLVVGKPQDDGIEARLQDAVEGDDRIRTELTYVPDHLIHRYMNAADVVVLPFRDVTTSGSAVLAMSFGKALVVPRLGCMPSLLDTDGTVFYDPENPTGLGDALVTVSSRDHEAMGAHNFDLAASNDWGQIAEKVLAVYRSVSSTHN